MEERQLICAAQKGDDAAFEELIGRYQAKIYGVCLRFLCSEEDARDAAQDCMIKIYLSLKSFRFRSAFSTWVYTVARNTALDHRRKRETRRGISLDALPDGGESLVILEDRTGESAEDAELRATLAELVNRLPEAQRRCVILKDIDGYSCEEIAEITGDALGTVKSRIHRGRNRLQEMLRERGLP